MNVLEPAYAHCSLIFMTFQRKWIFTTTAYHWQTWQCWESNCVFYYCIVLFYCFPFHLVPLMITQMIRNMKEKITKITQYTN